MKKEDTMMMMKINLFAICFICFLCNISSLGCQVTDKEKRCKELEARFDSVNTIHDYNYVLDNEADIEWLVENSDNFQVRNFYAVRLLEANFIMKNYNKSLQFVEILLNDLPFEEFEQYQLKTKFIIDYRLNSAINNELLNKLELNNITTLDNIIFALHINRLINSDFNPVNFLEKYNIEINYPPYQAVYIYLYLASRAIETNDYLSAKENLVLAEKKIESMANISEASRNVYFVKLILWKSIVAYKENRIEDAKQFYSNAIELSKTICMIKTSTIDHLLDFYTIVEVNNEFKDIIRELDKSYRKEQKK